MKEYVMTQMFRKDNKLVRIYQADDDDTQLYVTFGNTLIQVSSKLEDNSKVFHTNFRKYCVCYPFVYLYRRLIRKKNYFTIKDEAIYFGRRFESLVIGKYDDVYKAFMAKLYWHKDNDFYDFA